MVHILKMVCTNVWTIIIISHTHTHRNYKKKTPNPIELERIKVYFTCVVKKTLIQMDETESTIIVIIIILTDRSKKFFCFIIQSACVCVNNRITYKYIKMDREKKEIQSIDKHTDNRKFMS